MFHAVSLLSCPLLPALPEKNLMGDCIQLGITEQKWQAVLDRAKEKGTTKEKRQDEEVAEDDFDGGGGAEGRKEEVRAILGRKLGAIGDRVPHFALCESVEELLWKAQVPPAIGLGAEGPQAVPVAEQEVPAIVAEGADLRIWGLESAQGVRRTQLSFERLEEGF